MSNVPGIVPNILNNLVSASASPARAVAIVGHRDTDDINFPSTTQVYDTDVTANSTGVIYNYQNLGDWLTLLGQIETPEFVDGEHDDPDAPAAAITPHSPANSILYALALAYLANPSLNVYGAVIDGGSGGDPFASNDTKTAPTGVSVALNDLLLYDDIGYVVLAGVDPVAVGTTHVETATNSTSPPYNMPRFYVTGLDMFKVWDGETYAGAGKPLDDTDDLANGAAGWTAAKSDYGLTIAYIGNHDYNFSIIGDDNTRQIGGQYAAAYVAGFLASQKESAGVTFSTNALGSTRFTPELGDSTSIAYPFSLSEINKAIGEGWLITRFAQNSWVFAKGVNYIGTGGESWKLYSHRSITNFLHKSLADNLLQFLGRQQTQANLAAAQKLAEGILGDAVARNYISEVNAVTVKPHPTEVDAIIAEVEFITIKPINKIYLNITVS